MTVNRACMQLIAKIYINYWYSSHFHHWLVHWGTSIAGKSFLPPTTLFHDPFIFSIIHFHGTFCILASSRPCMKSSYGCVSNLALLWKLIKCLWFINISLDSGYILMYSCLSLSLCSLFTLVWYIFPRLIPILTQEGLLNDAWFCFGLWSS